MSDEIVPPLFIYPPTVPGWDVSGGSKLLAEPGLSEATAQSQLRRYAQKKWINTVGQRGTGPTAANLYGPWDLAAAKVLSELNALGIEDHYTLGHAAVGLYGWPDDQPRTRQGHKGQHPISAAMLGVTKNEWWAFQLRLLRHDQTGARHVRSYVYDAEVGLDTREERDPAYLPRVTVTIQLLPLLLPLHRKIVASLGAASVSVN